MRAQSLFGRAGWVTFSVVLGVGLLTIPAAQAALPNTALASTALANTALANTALANTASAAARSDASAPLPTSVTVGPSPVAIAADAANNAVWVANAGNSTVTEVSLTTRQVIATIPLASQPASLAAGSGSVWVGSQTANTVTQIHETTATVVNTYQVGDTSAAPMLVTDVQSYGVSVASGGDGTVWVIKNGTVEGPYHAGGSPGGIALAPAAWWVTDASGDTVNMVTATTSTPIKVGNHPTEVAYDPINHLVWVANQGDGTLSKISLANNPPSLVATYPAATGNFAFALDVNYGTVLVADTNADTLTVISEATGQTLGTVPVGSGPDAVAVPATAEPGSVWVANSNEGTVTVLAPPEITYAGPPTVTATTGQPFSLQLTATGNPVPQFSADALPAGLTISPTGLISGTPAANAGGTYAPLVKATNSLGLWQVYVFTVVSQPPSFITSDTGVTFTAGTFAFATVNAGGYPAPAVTESGRLPAGITFGASSPPFNWTTAQFSGTTGADSGGVYPITLTATNSLGTVTKAYTITVDQLPSITSPARVTFRAGRRGSFTIRTSGFPLVHVQVSGKLPKGLRLKIGGNGSATIAGTPASSTRHHTYRIKVEASNGLGTAVSQILTITIR